MLKVSSSPCPFKISPIRMDQRHKIVAGEKEAQMRINRIIGEVALVLCACSLFAQKSKDEESVWKLEHAYWEDVKTDDFGSYLALWHENSVAWPAWGAKPMRKNHITDWLGAYTLKRFI
jgi:hypothetical protein